MVRDIVSATGNTSLAAEALPLLMEEHRYWTSPPKQVTVWGPNAKAYNLSRYVGRLRRGGGGGARVACFL